MTIERIRPIAIGIFRQEDRILVFESREPDARGQIFYRPLGGSIEFGERGHEALARELREEIGAEIKNARYVGLNENLFHSPSGERAHEIVLVYEAELADETLYDKDGILVTEDSGATFEAFWKPLGLFQRGEAPLYPDGLLELLLEEDEGSPLPNGEGTRKERLR